jgi:hypothetical protein
MREHGEIAIASPSSRWCLPFRQFRPTTWRNGVLQQRLTESLDVAWLRGIWGLVGFRRVRDQQRWTVRLIAEEAVKRKLVPKVGRETIRILLQSHELKP